MAKKGQTFKSYSPELKEKVLKEYFEDGLSSFCLERKYNVPNQTIRCWVMKTRHSIDVKVGRRLGNSGRTKNKNLTLEDYKERYEILKKYQAFLQARREKK